MQANINIFVSPEQKIILSDIDLAEIGIVSSYKIETSQIPEAAFKISSIENIAVETVIAEGEKCKRCWKILPEVIGKDICKRCHTVITK